MAQEQMPQEQMPAEAQPSEQGQGGDQLTQLVSNINQGLGMLLDAAKEVNPEAAGALQGAMEQFQAAVQALSQGPQGATPEQSGPASPEAGASGAQQMGPQGVR